ncbi:aKG-HExxH-type peptide beta-hydroxylase [Streptomyces sp. NPDC050528]|uniref:aKG-HExxH-type peptide beta-hydroxylase n=1 Tax=Streptomyces sp. NPDC050528 TaxID=3365623 RepID=UPI003796A486
MISSALPDGALRELGRTAGGPDTLALLVRDQHTRRLLLLRAVLDAVEAADAAVCPSSVRDRLREDWALLEAADRTRDEGGTETWLGAGIRGSAALDRLLYPLVGPWARSCLRLLDGVAAGGDRVPLEGQERVRLLRRDLAHFSAIAAAAAVRAGVPFAVRLRARDGVLVLPSLGALRTDASGDAVVELAFQEGVMTFRQVGAADVVVRWGCDGSTTWSDALAWTAMRTLPGLFPGVDPVPLDDIDPFRTANRELRHRDLSGPAVVDAEERARWLRSWEGTASLLRLGGEHRLMEVAALLRCLVPLTVPVSPMALDSEAGGIGSCSGSRREAFGAVLSSTPPTPAAFAATLVHEIQHAKFAALSELVELHHAGPEERYFAPWRPDPRPYDALLHGAYSHLALADFFQRCALATTVGPAQRDAAWERHARHREQVKAALREIEASDELTRSGRLLVDRLIKECARMGDDPPPRRVREEAENYVYLLRKAWIREYLYPNG